MAVLDDPSRCNDHLKAVRALAAVEQQAKQARPTLEKILLEASDPALQLAAALAFERVTGMNGYAEQRVQNYPKTRIPDGDKARLEILSGRLETGALEHQQRQLVE